MTEADLALPWCALDVHIRPWRVLLRHGDHEAWLIGAELLDACAALELGREPQRAVRATVQQRALGRRASLSWTDLVGGAVGLTSRAAAHGDTSLADCLTELGLELLRVEYAPTTETGTR